MIHRLRLPRTRIVVFVLGLEEADLLVFPLEDTWENMTWENMRAAGSLSATVGPGLALREADQALRNPLSSRLPSSRCEM